MILAFYKRPGDCSCAAVVAVIVADSAPHASRALLGARDELIARFGEGSWEIQKAFRHQNLVVIYLGDRAHLGRAARAVGAT